jgi:CheY-like chemotaxis protein
MTRSVVLIDAEGEIRDIAQEALIRNRFEVLVADSGRQALDTLTRLAVPVVIVLGHRLPDMSSREFVAHLRDDWRLADTMVVLCLNPPRKRELLKAVRHAFVEVEQRLQV